MASIFFTISRNEFDWVSNTTSDGVSLGKAIISFITIGYLNRFFNVFTNQEKLLQEDLLEEFQELDIDFLSVDFLVDLLDDFDDLETKEEDFLQDSTAFELVGTSKGFDANTQFNTFLQEEFVVLYRQTSNSVRLDLQSNYGYNIFFEDEGKRNNIIINNGFNLYSSCWTNNWK